MQITAGDMMTEVRNWSDVPMRQRIQAASLSWKSPRNRFSPGDSGPVDTLMLAPTTHV